MKKYINLLFVFLIIPFLGIAQEGDDQTADDDNKEVKEKLERPAFESSFIVDNPTNVVNAKNAMEIQMEHRFGIMETWDDLGGIWGAANIRLGATYGVHERVTLGIGTQKYSPDLRGFHGDSEYSKIIRHRMA